MKKSLVILFCMLATACQTTGAGTGSTAANAGMKESLKLHLPKEFAKAAQTKDPKDGAYSVVYAPKGQKAASAKDKITIQFTPNMSVTPEQYYSNAAAALSKDCKEFSLDKPTTRKVEEFTIVRGAAYCPKNKAGKGEYSSISVTKGLTGIHSVQRTAVVPAYKAGSQPLDKATSGKWAGFFKGNMLCQHKGNDKKSRCVHI